MCPRPTLAWQPTSSLLYFHLAGRVQHRRSLEPMKYTTQEHTRPRQEASTLSHGLSVRRCRRDPTTRATEAALPVTSGRWVDDLRSLQCARCGSQHLGVAFESSFPRDAFDTSRPDTALRSNHLPYTTFSV